MLTALQDITGTSSQRFQHPDFIDNLDDESDLHGHVENSSTYLQERQPGSSFSVSGNWLELFYGNGTLQWREDLCKIGHFVQIERNLVGITDINADLLLQLQAVAEWVMIYCGVVIPVSSHVPGDERFLHVINASNFNDINSSVAALHHAAIVFRKSSKCSDFSYGFDEFKKCASSLSQNKTFNSTLLMQIFEPFVGSSPQNFAVYSSSCLSWENLPQSGLRSPSDGNVHVEMWVSCTKTRRVLALSKSAIMLLSAVAKSTCELQVSSSLRCIALASL